MTALPKPQKLTPEEYLAFEEAAEFKSEFYEGEMFAMAGASGPHVDITYNLTVEIGSRLKGGKCRARGNDQRVRIAATGLYTYPDLTIVCEKPQTDPGKTSTLLNPSVLIEVLSKSTEKYDRGIKLKHYQKIPSLREVALVSQDQPRIEVIARDVDGAWTTTVFDDLSQDFVLSSVPLNIPMSDIYRDVDFSEAE